MKSRKIIRVEGAPSEKVERHAGESQVFDDLFSLVYEELRRLASAVRRNDPVATINSTGLVHEAWFRLRRSPSLASSSAAHFKAIAARAMRQVLVDEARRRHARKRGGAEQAILVDDWEALGAELSTDEELLALDSAMVELASQCARQATVVECRFFGGLSVAETASVMNVSESSIERDWRSAKAWLASRVRPVRE